MEKGSTNRYFIIILSNYWLTLSHLQLLYYGLNYTIDVSSTMNFGHPAVFFNT